MLDKGSQTQKTSGGSLAVQSGRDTYIGMQFSEVQNLCQLFLENNFPKLRQEAIEEAKTYVDIYAQKLFVEISKISDLVDIENRLRKPDVQSSINDSVQYVARKTDKAEIDALTTLVCDKISSESESILDMVLAESIRIMEKMNKSSIVFCAFVAFVRQLRLDYGNEDALGGFEKTIGVMFPLEDVSYVDLSYLRHVGVCSGDQFYNNDLITHLNSRFHTSLNKENCTLPLEFGNDFSEKYPNMANIVLKFGFDNLENFDRSLLTIVGRYMATAYLRSKGMHVSYSPG